MKDSLISIVGEENMRRDFPPELLRKQKSDKVLKKIMGECIVCHEEIQKNEMVSLTARTKRGGRTKAFAYMCMPCFSAWCEKHDIPVPNLEGLYDQKGE